MDFSHDYDDLPTPAQSISTGSVPVQPQQGKKRTKYTPAACDQCKKRKVKCNGSRPCQRCAQHPSRCSYAPRRTGADSATSSVMSQMNDKIHMLQEQIEMLMGDSRLPPSSFRPSIQDRDSGFTDAGTVSTERLSAGARPSQRKRKARGHPGHLGSTSNAFSLGRARSSLQNMGVQLESDSADDGLTSSLTTPCRTPRSSESRQPLSPALSLISLTEVIRLIDLYEEETGTIYPFLDVDQIKACAHRTYASVRSYRNPSVYPTTELEVQKSADDDVDIMKMAIAIALAIEGHGLSKMGERLAEEVELSVDKGIRLTKPDIRGLKVLALMSIYQFHCDEEILAWRTIGAAVRLGLEAGLHRRDTLLACSRDPNQRRWVIKLFWCVYVLDRRWSFGAGMPFALQDMDIDPDLPEPDDGHSYLTSMIAYGHIGSKVWKAMSGFSRCTPQIKPDKAAYLDFQVLQWQNSIPFELKLSRTTDDIFEGHSRSTNRLRVLLYLRANQMKILIHGRTLMTPATIMGDLASAQVAVDTAKDSIRLLEKMNRLTDIYIAQQTCFNYFLVSSLAVILLAVCHATTQFNQSCREEYFAALDLIKGLSATSFVAKKLWETIKYLKVAGPKLGIIAQNPGHQLPGANNTITSGGATEFPADSSTLAEGTNRRPFAVTSANVNSQNEASSDLLYPFSADHDFLVAYTPYPRDGNQLSDELTSIFEAIEPRVGTVSGQFHMHGSAHDQYSFGTDEDLSRTLINLF
ncbi:hypothetical protein LTR06_008911 [Exophiala xenobiotica]|nr:hypothetical protein LTR06_008911 [Exophiala xenobiotica]